MDNELLIAVHNNDCKAFEELYFRYFDPLSRYAFKKLQDESIVEELVQDVFVDFWKKRADLDLGGDVAGLLFAMLRNKTLHELRARMIKSRHIEIFLFLHKDDVAEEVTDELYARQIKERLDQAVNRLSPQCREAFTLSRYEHLTYREIAERMKISVNTVEKHIGKALQFLRQQFREYQLPIIVIIGLLQFLK